MELDRQSVTGEGDVEGVVEEAGVIAFALLHDLALVLAAFAMGVDTYELAFAVLVTAILL